MNSYGLIGEKLVHSLSPKIHQLIFEALSIDGQYSLFEIEPQNIANVVSSAKTLGLKGFNVTIPYKTAVIPLLDEISPEAEAIGAVNVVDFRHGQAIGYNSDYYGFATMLELSGIAVNGKDIVILGAGGAAKAVIAYLNDADAKNMKVVGRSMDKLSVFMEQFPFIEPCLFSDEDLITGDILINCTPIGTFPNINECPIPLEFIPRFSSVVDLIYNPAQTMLTKKAEELGLTTTNGLYMLIYQAIKAEEIWQGIIIDKHLAVPIINELQSQLSIIQNSFQVQK